MSLGHNLVMCNLCGREEPRFNKNKVETSRFFGLTNERNKNYNIVLGFVKINQTPINKHICTSCISDILNEFAYKM